MSTPEQRFDCPSDETLAALADGLLDRTTRRTVMEHMVSCDTCAATFQSVADFLECERSHAGENVQPFRRRKPVIIGTSVAAAAAIALVILIPLRDSLRNDPSALLNDANAGLETRAFPERITGFAYRRLDARRGPADDDPASVRIASGKLEQRAARENTPAVHEAWAISELMSGEWDNAVKILERVLTDTTGESGPAAITKSKDAELLTHLAAAYLARARELGRDGDIPLALNAAERAWQLQRTPTTTWNRALALEAMNQSEDALLTWRNFHALETDRGWADEGKRREAELRNRRITGWEEIRPRFHAALASGDMARVRAIAKAYSRKVYSEVWTGLLTEAVQSGSADALRQVTWISETFAASGDRFLADTLVSLQRAIGRGGAEAEAARTGVAAFAGKQYVAAAEALHRIGSPLASLADAEEAAVLITNSDSEQALRRLQMIEPSEHPLLSARVGWLHGLVDAGQARPYAASKHYTTALTHARQINDADWQAAILALLAQSRAKLGLREAAWKARIEALRVAEAAGDDNRIQYVGVEALMALVGEELVDAGEVVADRLAVEIRPERPLLLDTSVYIWRARLHIETGDEGLARRDLAAARTIAAGLTNRDRARRFIAYADLAEGRLLATRVPLAAVARLDAAEAFLDDSKERFQLAEVFAWRASAYERLHRLDRAKQDYDRATAEVEQQRNTIDDPALREAFLAAAHELFEREIRAEVAAGDVMAAYEVSERARARSLLARYAASPNEVASLDRVRAALPSDAVLVEYFSTDDELLVWSIARSGVTFRRVPVARRELERVAAAMIREAREGRRESCLEAAGRAYELLIRPIEESMRGARSITFVPDPALESLPFSALYDLRARRHLIETFEVTHAPSATELERLLKSVAPSWSPRVTVFAVPSADPVLFPGLRTLPYAHDEARMINGLVPGTSVYLSSEATRERFLEALRQPGVVHFTGHGLLSADNPEFSALLLSGEPLMVRDLRTQHARAELVVLAACDTNRRAIGSRDGASSLTYAFLAAGVPSVVGTAWDVEDGSTKSLMTRFYQHLASGASPAAALRRAKIEELHATADDPRASTAWMAYELVGVGTLERARRAAT